MVKGRTPATKRRRRRPANDRRSANVNERDGFPQWEHGAFTFEGEIERLGSIGKGMSTAPRWTRLMARGLAIMILVPMAVGLAQFLLRLVF